jgi:hypothetical protein
MTGVLVGIQEGLKVGNMDKNVILNILLPEGLLVTVSFMFFTGVG